MTELELTVKQAAHALGIAERTCRKWLEEGRLEGRKDLGDVSSLARSIKSVGLLHPPVVTPDLRLVAGERRLAAVRSLGWIDCPVTVAETLTDVLIALQAERDENTCRKELAPTRLTVEPETPRTEAV